VSYETEDKKQDVKMLWDALDNLVSLWDMEADMHALEDSVARAREVLYITNLENKDERAA